MNFNECVLVGRLTRDPEIREVAGTNVVMFTVASNRSFTKKDGEKAEKTLFMDCELWGKAAQIVADRGVKGTTILVRGPIEQDNFQAQDGSKRTRYKLRVDFFQFGEGSVKPQREEVAAGAEDSADNAPF
jgi:single-strand DNA-binding protein